MSATRLIRITCDGPICRPARDTAAGIFGEDTTVGTLGGGYLVLPHSSIETVRQVAAKRHRWHYDRFRKADLCPRCVDALRDRPPVWADTVGAVPGAGRSTG